MQLKATNESPFRSCVSIASLLARQLMYRTTKILENLLLVHLIVFHQLIFATALCGKDIIVSFYRCRTDVQPKG